MTQVVAASGHASLTRYGKRQVAASMYVKGKAFVGAAILTRRHGNSEPIDYVMLHLLCQGIEVILKSLLLFRDYDGFITRLRKPLGHNLLRIAKDASVAYGLKPLCRELEQETRILTTVYSQQLLRYGTGYDILVDPHTISRDRAFRRIAAVIRLTEREMNRAPSVI